MDPITIKKVREIIKYCHQKAQKDLLYQEIQGIREKFLEYRLDQGDKWSWLLMNDFLECMNLGLYFKKQRAKAVEVCLKYGEDTLFWKELQRTKSQRKLDTLRVAHAVRQAGKVLDKGGLSRKTRYALAGFKIIAIDFRKKLLINPLTEKQKKVLWKVERICGIYYKDLSAEENGITREKNVENIRKEIQ